MAKKPPKKRDRIVIDGIPYRLVLFEVTGLFPNGKFRHLKRITEESTVRVDTPEPKWFVTAYIQDTVQRMSKPLTQHPNPDEN
jgi:hypothetical protein